MYEHIRQILDRIVFCKMLTVYKDSFNDICDHLISLRVENDEKGIMRTL